MTLFLRFTIFNGQGILYWDPRKLKHSLLFSQILIFFQNSKEKKVESLQYNIIKPLSKKYKVEPNYVGKKHMFDLLNHFGCKESVAVFKKKETV